MMTYPKRILVVLLALVVAAPLGASTFPARAQAQFVVIDPAHIAVSTPQLLKDVGLDGIAWVIAKTAISSMTRSLVNWINSGFEGSPAFATDLERNLLRVSDAVVAMTVAEIAGNVTDGLLVNSPYQDEIATAIRTGYYLSTGGSFYVRNPFTLGNYSDDPLAFLSGDFSNGGFQALHSTILFCQNNPYCAYQLASKEVTTRAGARGGQLITELDWGDGFMSFRGKCKPLANAKEAVAALNDVDNCVGQPIQTPGTVIEGQLNETLPKGMEGLVTADEIDEVIGALFQQLVTQVIGQTGLRGVSVAPSGGGRPFIDQATGPNQQPSANTIDPDTAAQLTVFESNWKVIGVAADRALDKCPDSSVARQALRDSLTAQARVDGARRALAQPGASEGILGSVMPSDAEIAASSLAASGDSGSTRSRLDVISSSKSCPSD